MVKIALNRYWNRKFYNAFFHWWSDDSVYLFRTQQEFYDQQHEKAQGILK